MRILKSTGLLLLGGMLLFLGSCATGPMTSHPLTLGWERLVAADLSDCTYSAGSWTVEDGVLTRQGGGSIWTKKTSQDFILDLEFKVGPKTNSGIFFRTADIADSVQTGIEMQVYDSLGRETPSKYDCGAIYDCQEPSINAMKKAGEWNRVTIKAIGPRIQIVMNGQQIIDMDLNRWTEAHKNPDGTKNKFNTAYQSMTHTGHFGFQDHGNPVWYRNIRIKRLR